MKTINIQNQIRTITQQLINNNDKEGINILMGITGSIDFTNENSTQFNGLLKMFDISNEKPIKYKVKYVPIKSENKYGFKVTNPTLESIIDTSEKVPYNPLKHLTVRELGYKSNYQLNKLGKKRLLEFQKNGGTIFVQSDSKKSRNNQVKYLFSK
jgi:hypothetical protein